MVDGATLGHRHIACGNTITNFRSNFIVESCSCSPAPPQPPLSWSLDPWTRCRWNVIQFTWSCFIWNFSLCFFALVFFVGPPALRLLHLPAKFCKDTRTLRVVGAGHKWNYTLFRGCTQSHRQTTHMPITIIIIITNNENKYDKQTNWK